MRRLRDGGLRRRRHHELPEFGILPTTEPRHAGPTRNPWDLERTPGGSSGGAAAAVAAGLVPIAHGNDGGGSIRIPAACCGLVGLKPSRGRISRGPDLGDSFLGADGVLTRTVADTALLLDVLAGYEAGDATWAPRPAEPYTTRCGAPRAAAHRDHRSTTRSASTRDPEVVRAAARGGRRCCATLGHEVVEASPAAARRRTCWTCSSRSSGPQRRARHRATASCSRAAPPAEDEIEPLSRAVAELRARRSRRRGT